MQFSDSPKPAGWFLPRNQCWFLHTAEWPRHWSSDCCQHQCEL